jgi:hypothetical protein
MKQTAVEWLENELIQFNFNDTQKLVLSILLYQAKEMHKEQIINAYIEASENFDDITKETAEHFYRETYGK